MSLASKGAVLFPYALWGPRGTGPGASAVHFTQAASHQPQRFLSNDLDLMQANDPAVKGSIAHKPGKRYSAVLDVHFYFYCSSTADPSHIGDDKLSGISGVKYLCPQCPLSVFFLEHTQYSISYSLEGLFTIGTGIKD